MTEVGYASDKPSDCAYCYFFSAGRKKCKRKECFYRISSPPLRRKVTHWEPCEGCPYGKHTPCLGYCIDEFHLLLKEEQTASYSVEIWKRFRKWGGIPTGITQNVKDLLASREIENIFENSDFILMLNQASGDRQILAKQLNISPHQLSYVTNSGEGEGLVFYGSTIIPFKDKFDNSLMLYALMTSKPDEVEKRKKLGIGERDD